MTQKISVRHRHYVRGIIDPDQPVFVRISHQVGPRHAQQRPHDESLSKSPDARHAVQPATLQQPQQDRFDLVVPMMRKQQARAGRLKQIAKHAIAGLSRRRLRAAGRRDLDAVDTQRNAKTLRLSRAMIRPGVSVRLQTVMHVNSAWCRFAARRAGSTSGMQQHAGVEPAAVANPERGRVRRSKKRINCGDGIALAMTGCAFHAPAYSSRT